MSVKTYNEAYDYPIKTLPSGRIVIEPPLGVAGGLSRNAFIEEAVKDNRIWFGS
jgi:hypothetical protein